MNPTVKKLIKAGAQQTIGRLPRSPTRMIGKLAEDGGTPVRNVRYRPWRKNYNNDLRSWLGGARAALRSVFLSGVEGLPQPLAKQFAEQWAAYCGARYALLMPHGTDALRIALAAVLEHDGLDYGGEIIVPNLSFIASVNAALDRRFGVALVDVDADTLLLDPRKVEEAIIPGKTRAIMPVHLFGQPANMTALRAVADQHGLKIVEDAAQAHGSVCDAGRIGSLGDAAAFSFQSHKNLTCGEGGALTTDDSDVFERAYSLHNVGRARVDGERWGHQTLGWNCRPTEYQAALLLERFKRFEDLQERRRRNYFALREMISDIACVQPQKIPSAVLKHGVHMLVMRYKQEHCDGVSTDEFIKACGAEGAPMYRSYELTMAEQPAIRNLLDTRPQYIRVMSTPVADQAVKELLYIPQEIFLGTKGDMKDIAAAIAKVGRYYAKAG